jgi:hypothetical protein
MPARVLRSFALPGSETKPVNSRPAEANAIRRSFMALVLE